MKLQLQGIRHPFLVHMHTCMCTHAHTLTSHLSHNNSLQYYTLRVITLKLNQDFHCPKMMYAHPWNIAKGLILMSVYSRKQKKTTQGENGPRHAKTFV